MHHHFTILFLLAQITAFTQTADTTANLAETVVLAARIQMPFSEESRTVQILTREQLAAMPVHTVAEALQSITGLDVRQRGPMGVQTDLHVRGGGFDQALVLLNGVRLSDPQTGHHLMNIPVDWSAIERIEILKGPGARIYGQNAFACAINIVTRVPEEKAVKVSFSAGDFDYQGAGLYLARPVGRLRQQMAVSGDRSGGYRTNTDFDIVNGFYQAQLSTRSGKGQWDFLADFNQRAFGANGYYGRLEFTDQYEEVQTSLASLGYTTTAGNWTLKPRIYWRRNQDVYDFQRSVETNAVNFHLSQVAGGELNTTRHWKKGQQTGLGINAEFTGLYSSRLGIRERTTVNLFAEHRMVFFNSRLDLTPGISVSHFSDFGTFFYPGIDAGLRLSNNWRWYANAGYNYRIPTFTDLYYEDAGSKGNPELQPERAFSAESGLRFRSNDGNLTLQTAVFRRDGRNLIDWTKENQADKWETRNYNTVLAQGFEVNGEWQFRTLRITAGYTFLDAQVSNQVAFSRYTLNNLRHQLNGSADVRFLKNWQLGVRSRWCDRVVQDPSVKSDYTVTDGKLSFNYRRFQVFAEAINVFDATYGEIRYSDTAVLTMPGRWFRGGVTVKL